MSYVGSLWGAVNIPATLLGSHQWDHRHEEANGNDRVSFTKEGCDHIVTTGHMEKPGLDHK